MIYLFLIRRILCVIYLYKNTLCRSVYPTEKSIRQWRTQGELIGGDALQNHERQKFECQNLEHKIMAKFQTLDVKIINKMF